MQRIPPTRKQSEEEKQKRRLSILKTKRERGVSEETRRKLREANKNFYNRPDIEYIKKERKKRNIERGVYEKLSERAKENILSGKFTPPRNNYYKHKRFESKITGLASYRSGWERDFHELYPHLSYESVRIPYVFQNQSHVYIVDFADYLNKVLIEIKPKEHILSEKNIAKFAAAVEWSNNNGWQYKVITKTRGVFVAIET